MNQVSIKNESSATQYKFDRTQRVRNIRVDCHYFENTKQISFGVTIRLFGERKDKSKAIYCFEIYGNTQNPKYNRISRRTKDYDAIPLVKGFAGYDTFERVLAIINSEFDSYTTNFILCAKKLIDGSGTLNETPQFIMDVIEQHRELNDGKVINAN